VTRLAFRQAARADLRSIYRYIAADNPIRARSFVLQIRTRCTLFREHPLVGRDRSDLAPGLRSFPLGGNVIIAYRPTPAVVEIVRIFYGGQDYETFFRAGNDP